jgi:hypothetical protein
MLMAGCPEELRGENRDAHITGPGAQVKVPSLIQRRVGAAAAADPNLPKAASDHWQVAESGVRCCHCAARDTENL